MHRFFLVLPLVASCVACSAPAVDPRVPSLLERPAARVALEYLGALRDADWARAESLAHPDLWYFDPTMEIFDRPPIDHRDRASMLAFYRAAHEESGTSEVRWDVVDGFEAGPWIVLELRLFVTGSGAFWDVDTEEVSIRDGRQVSALRVEGGRVTDHVDLVAYGDALEQIDALRARFGPAR